MSTAEQAAQPGTVADNAAAGSADDDAGEMGREALNADRPDLTWLLHRAAQHMRTALDEAAQAHGLADAREWVVLTEAGRGIQAEVTRARDRVEGALLADFTQAEQRQLRELLARLAAGPGDHGSCR